jgi:hypothetical protein
MSIERISVIGMVASFALALGTVSGQDFNERYAAWQGGRAPVQRRAPAATQVVQASNEVVETREAAPARTSSGPSQKIMADVYSAPYHTPNYNAPWNSGSCATCNHNATFEPASDAIGSCGLHGGGWLPGTISGGCGCGECGESCGPGGCGMGCGPCGGKGGGYDYGPLCCNTLVWMKFEALMWWRQGREIVPLVTTDPTTESSTTAGILPDAQILYGGDGRIAAGMQGGARIDFGFFLDPTQTIGFGDRVYGVGKGNSDFSVQSNNVPVLAIPFRDLDTGNNDALLVAYPGLRTGEININNASSFFGNDVYARFLLCRDCNTRIDFITGWNYTRLADNMSINSQQTVTEIGGTIPVGTVTTITDQFNALNQFHGAILGLQWQRNCGVWSWQTMGRVSLGNMSEALNINGNTTIASPGQATQTLASGLFTGPNNIGRNTRNEFTSIWELGLNLAYRFAPCTQLHVGYSLIYINDVLSPGNSIDTSIGGANDNPVVAFQHSDFWIQGINLGISKEF